MIPRQQNLPAPCDMDLPTLLRECARVLGNSGGAKCGAELSEKLSLACIKMIETMEVKN